jgi:hypothetical protein
MRKIQAAKEQSELRRLSQACFHLLVSERENICDPVLANYTDVFSRGGKTIYNQQFSRIEARRLSRCEHYLILISHLLSHAISRKTPGGASCAQEMIASAQFLDLKMRRKWKGGTRDISGSKCRAKGHAS